MSTGSTAAPVPAATVAVPKTQEEAEALATKYVARMERLPPSGYTVKLRVIVGAASFFDSFDAGSMSYIMAALTPLWALTAAQTGSLLSATYIGQIAGAIFFGWLAEKKGRMVSLQLSVATFAIFSLLCGLSPNFGLLFWFRIIQGFGLGGEVPVAASYVSEIARAKGRGFFVLIFEWAFALAIFVTALVAQVVIPTLGWEWMFFIGTAPAVLIIFFRRNLKESPRWLMTQGRWQEADEAISMLEYHATDGGKKELPPVQVKPVVHRKGSYAELFQGIYLKRTLVVWCMWFGSYFLAGGIRAWTPVILRTVYNVPLAQTLQLATIGAFFSAFMPLVAAMLIDRVGRKGWIAGVLFLGSLPLLLLWQVGTENMWVFYGLTVLSGSIMSTNGLVMYIYSPEIYPTRLRALGNSVATMWIRVASALNPIIIAFIIAGYGLASVGLFYGVAGLVFFAITAWGAIETKGQVLETLSP